MQMAIPQLCRSDGTPMVTRIFANFLASRVPDSGRISKRKGLSSNNFFGIQIIQEYLKEIRINST